MSGENDKRIERPAPHDSVESTPIRSDLGVQEEAKDLARLLRRQQAKKFSDATMGQYLDQGQLAAGGRFELVDNSEAARDKEFLHTLAQGLDRGSYLDAALVRDLADMVMKDVRGAGRVDKELVADVAHVFAYAAKNGLIWDKQTVEQYAELLRGGTGIISEVDPNTARDIASGLRDLAKRGPELEEGILQLITGAFTEAIAKGGKVDPVAVADFSHGMTEAMISNGQMDLNSLQKFHDGLVEAAKHGLQIDAKVLQQLQDGIKHAAETGTKMDKALLQKFNSAVDAAAAKSSHHA